MSTGFVTSTRKYGWSGIAPKLGEMLAGAPPLPGGLNVP